MHFGLDSLGDYRTSSLAGYMLRQNFHVTEHSRPNRQLAQHHDILGHSNKSNSFARISQKGPHHTIIIAFCLEYGIVMLLSMRSS